MRRALALGLAATALVAAPAAPAYAEDVTCQSVQRDTVPAPRTTRASTPLELLQVSRAHELLDQRPGRGRGPVGVAVVDSGVAAGWHAAAVAGLVAGEDREDGGPVGVAPRHARVVDVRVWDDQGDRDGPSSADVARGLQRVAREAKGGNIRVAVVAFEVDGSRQLEQAVRAATDAGVLVVAAAGDRDQLGGGYEEFTPGDGEDAAGRVHPAGYADVLAVTSVAAGMPGDGDAREYVVQSSATDIAAPTWGAVSTGVKGTCVLEGLSSHWAAAEVAGVAALLWSAYPGDTVEQIRTRLLETASGRTDLTTVTEGAGIVQPTEALTRPLSPPGSGRLARPSQEVDAEPPAEAPEAAADQLAEMRGSALWWGLVGGIAIVVVLLLRPLLRRR